MRTLTEWLEYQQRIHPREVELGLQRVGVVWRRMGAPAPAPVVITVGGTNGKGSTVAFLHAMLAAAGKRVGCYTSPHLLHYNERVQVQGADVDDASLIAAFERIESAREQIALTYFEFGTLAALWIFAHSRLDVAVLEVGLGGRLDAVNIIDADAAIVTTVDMDHMDWLGCDIDSIGREKAGIFRANRPAIVGMRNPPSGLLAQAAQIGAQLHLAGRDFHAMPQHDGWDWRCSETDQANRADVGNLSLPEPGLPGNWQFDNAAAAIAALHALRNRIGWNPTAMAMGIENVKITARVQRFRRDGNAELIIDVAHNPQASAALAQWLARQSSVRNFAVFGALRDKDVGGVVTPLLGQIHAWFAADLTAASARGLDAVELVTRMRLASPTATITSLCDVTQALDAAAQLAGPNDRMVAMGSFFVAAAALEWAQRHGYNPAA